MSATSPEYPKLQCKSAKIFFIYSFCLESDDGDYLVDIDQFIAEKKDDAELEVTSAKPPSRAGITPHLSFTTSEGWSVLPPLDGTLGGEPIKIERLLRILPVGATVCISVELPARTDRKIGKDLIMEILKLIRRREASSTNPQSLDVKGFGPCSLFTLFQRTVDRLLDGSSFNWLEKHNHLIDLDQEIEPQTPWVVTLLEVEGAEKKAFCSDFRGKKDPVKRKVEAIRPFLPEIAPILFRSVSSARGLILEPAYLPTRGDNFSLFSMNLDARLFVTMSRRSILCICSEMEQDPTRYFLPGLLDLCEMVRVRWHMLVVMHRLMDKTVRSMRKKPKEDLLPKEKLQEIIKLREWMATSLEDPGIYVLAGDALSKLHEHLQEIFSLRELRETILGKIDLLDRLYGDMIQSDWMEQLSRRPKLPSSAEG